ncbi:MAG TPA: ThiF family adenylyltransferase [Candidatus Acidoferrum sp.]|nr:ThiF family adenylyltransferase [Candidatus Acidoferrum sp.]
MNARPKDAASFERYSRQILFAGIGESGQQRLALSGAVIVGCGATGAFTAALLARAGVGRLRILDRDFVEPSNLQRQSLFDESDANNSLPKAIAAQQRLRAINSSISIEGIVADLTPRNAEELLSGFDLILDGTDNFETRFLINDFAIKKNLPWIYAAAVGSYGVTMAIRPGLTACLACLFDGEHAPSGAEETCDTVGVLGPVVQLISSLESGEAIKLLAGKENALHGRLISSELWSGRFQSLTIPRNPDCRACSHRDFSYLEGDAQPHVTMCGRDSVQIHERSRSLDLAALGARLSPAVEFVRQNDFLLRFSVPPYEMTVFADGRAILKGSQDPAIARSLYARFIGA